MRQKESKLKQPVDELRPEYDFSRGVRGKHAARYAAGTNVVVLEPDVATAFPTATDVNEASGRWPKLSVGVCLPQNLPPNRLTTGCSRPLRSAAADPEVVRRHCNALANDQWR